ncbi:MAG TPA: hypothetical protein VGG54_23035 [Trebonia sp.]|jgi:hypothetical protein
METAEDGGSAAARGAGVEERALSVLRLNWEHDYDFGFDYERNEYWAARKDRIGALLWDATPEKLDEQVRDEHGPGTVSS